MRQQPALVQPISVDVTISQISNAELSLSSNCQYLGKEGDDSGRCLAGSQAQSIILAGALIVTACGFKRLFVAKEKRHKEKRLSSIGGKRKWQIKAMK